jgi:hypothetical protein
MAPIRRRRSCECARPYEREELKLPIHTVVAIISLEVRTKLELVFHPWIVTQRNVLGPIDVVKAITLKIGSMSISQQ